MTESEDKESLARAHLPYRAEYCKTNRARCKKCQQMMEANSLKLANLTKSRFHDGYDASFYHVACFFQIKRPTSVAEIRHFETLKYDDQQMLEKAVETRGLSVLGDRVDDIDETKDSKKSAKRTKKRNVNESDPVLVNYNDFMIEYAKSNRSKCNLCEEKIDKESVRIGKLDYDAETAWKGGPVPRWFHIECFAKSAEQLEFFGQVDKIKNFDELESDDQKMIKKKVKPLKAPSAMKEAANGSKKLKAENDEQSAESKAEEAKEVKLLKKQSDQFFALREVVNSIKRKDLELLLDHMQQRSSFRAASEIVDAATDVLMFGPLERCPTCKKTGGMVLRGGGYICTKGPSEWEQCTYETREPKRNVPDIPDELVEKYPFFQDEYKFHAGQRIFPSRYIKAIEKKEAEDNKIVQDGAPLEGLTIGVISWKGVNMDKTKVQKKVTILGGKIQTALDKSLFVILSSEEQLFRDDPKVCVAKALNVPFAAPGFLFNIDTKDDVVPRLTESLIGDWDGDLEARYNKLNVKQLQDNIKSRSSANVAERLYKSSRAPKSHTLVIKEGTAVDPDSGYSEVGKVYRREPHIYSVVLNSVDVMRDKNSFYKLQVIEHDTKKRYFFFRSWGRIGCEIGGSTCDKMKDAETAVARFEQLFEEKTGNPFSSIASNSFMRNHGMYFPVELDYGEKDGDKNGVELKYSANSKLSKAVQELICLIFDVNRMNDIMREFELDAEKMPLGKLSQKHILQAMETLKDLEQALRVNRASRKILASLTNKFYSHVPQSFGSGKVQLIDSLKQVEEKNLMLASLSEIEIAYSMCKTIDRKCDQLPIDQHYMQLNCSMESLDANGNEFELVSNYLHKTCASTHSSYSLDIQQVFRVQREADMKRFKVHKPKERALLWHGSRTTNYAGILSQGLRIAPSEAPVTGYMFGKGIYFADMSTKSANYCWTDPSNNVGLLLLCEVALGKMYELLKSDENLPANMPDGFDSVKGVGKNKTDPETHIKIEDDILVPIGKQVAAKGDKKKLLYNEYIIYQESQAMIRYIVQVQFDYKI